jgi:hypothetical protein
MLRWCWNFNHSFLSLFQELTTLGNFLLCRTVKKLSHRKEINIFNIYDSALLKNIFENNLLLFRLPLTITELRQFFAKNLVKNSENALLEKILKHF